VGGEYFCDHCIKIQPAPSDVDYFQRLGLPRHLTLDLHDLERRFHDLSRKIHPDLFQRRSEEEKAISLQNSAVLNTAYRTLRDPILRAEYLISLEEGAVKDIPAKAPPNLLEEIMELQETLEEFKRVRVAGTEKGTELRKTLIAERDRFGARKEILEMELLGLFQEWDRFQDQRPPHPDGPQEHQSSLLRRMKDLLSARAYLKTLLQDLDEGLRDHS
jgi:molecular chaperone HscB